MFNSPRFEVGVDYSATSSRHYQYNETHEFSNSKTDRIFMPNMGVYYVKDLIVRDVSTNKVLEKGIDYLCSILDEVATEKSGLECCGIIEVTNPDVLGVIIEYRFVGGIHTGGIYLLDHLMRMYPKGIHGVIEWSNVLNKNTEWDPSYHTHHVQSMYNSESFLIALEKVRCGWVQFYQKDFNKLFDLAQARIDALYDRLGGPDNGLNKEVTDAFEMIKVQGEEYILTDNPTNPKTERGYGEWVQIKNAILYGHSSNYLIGSGSMIALGTDQVLRNTYIWKNVSTKTQAKYSVSATKDAIVENENIQFNIQTEQVPQGAVLNWLVIDRNDPDLVGGIKNGSVSVNAQGKATVVLSFPSDTRRTGNKSYQFLIQNIPNLSKDFVLVDTSDQRKLEMITRKPNTATAISEVDETGSFDLFIQASNINNETITLSYSGLNNTDFKTPPATSVVAGVTPTTLRIDLVGDNVQTGGRTLVIEARDSKNKLLASTTLYIQDTSQALTGQIAFLKNNVLVNAIDEGDSFQIRTRTNGGVGRTLTFQYSSNKNLDEFTGLVSEGVIDSGSMVMITPKLKNNYATATTPEWLKVDVFYSGTLIDSKTLAITDQSKTPAYVCYFSSDPQGANEITSVDEGSVFYYIQKVFSWTLPEIPPLLQFDYQFEGAATALSDLRNRIDGSFYSELVFGDGNGKGDVSWINNNTLSVKMTAIADNRVSGDVDFTVRSKPNALSAWAFSKSIRINDTSLPTVEAKWSSSPSTLVPISSINEMSTIGDSITAYLWLSCTLDGRPYQSIRLTQLGTMNRDDVLNDFPTAVNFTQANQNQIIPISLRPDFVQDGDKTLIFKGEYTSNKGVTRTLFVSSLTVLDNSRKLPLTVAMSSKVGNSSTGFTEWEPVTVRVDSPQMNFATTFELEIKYSDGSDASSRFNNVALSASAQAMATGMNFTLQPKVNFITYPNNSFVLVARRKLPNGQVISQDFSMSFNMKNDAGGFSVAGRMYSDPERTQMVTELEEGRTYYGQAIITNPDKAMVLAINNPFANETVKGNGPDRYTGRSQGYVVYGDSNKVLRSIAKSNGATEIIHNFSFTVPSDRQTNYGGTANRWLKLKLITDAEHTNYGVGEPYNTNGVDNDSRYKILDLDYLIKDTSKTLSNNIRFVNTSNVDVSEVNEGDVFNILMDYNDATIGDEYYVQIKNSSGVTQARFELQSFGVRRSVVANSGRFSWNFKVAANRQTDGDRTLTVELVNATSGTIITMPATLMVRDTSRTTGVTARWYANGSSVEANSINEGDNFKLVLTLDNFQSTDQVTLTRTGGRPLSDFVVNEFGQTKQPTLVNGKYTAEYNFSLRRNQKDDTDNVIQARLQGGGLDVPISISVNDVSRTHGISRVEWRDSPTPNGGSVIGSVNEGATAYLHVYTTGGTDQYNLTCTNDGGRAPEYLGGSNYGVTRTRASDTVPMVWSFTPLIDGLTNSSQNSQLRVNITTSDQPAVTVTPTLSINDTSTDTVVIWTGSPPGSVNEGSELNTSITISNTTPNTTYKLVEAPGQSRPSSNFSRTSYGAQTTSGANGGSVTLPINFIPRADNTTNTGVDLLLGFKVEATGGLGGNRTFGPFFVQINDTSKSIPEFEMKLVNSNSVNATQITSMNEGDTAYILINTKYYTGKLNIDFTSSNPTSGYLLPTRNWEVDVTEYWGQSFLIPLVTRKDEETTGNISGNLALRSGGTSLRSVAFTINETSIRPEILSAYWATDSDGNTPLTDKIMGRGDTVYLVVKTKGIPQNSVLSLNFPYRSAGNGDFSEGQVENTVGITISRYNAADQTGSGFYKMVINN